MAGAPAILGVYAHHRVPTETLVGAMLRAPGYPPVVNVLRGFTTTAGR